MISWQNASLCPSKDLYFYNLALFLKEKKTREIVGILLSQRYLMIIWIQFLKNGENVGIML